MPAVDYRAIFEKAEVGIALNDPDAGTVGTVNDRYAMLMGYPREELRDMAIEEISAEDPRFDQDAAMEKIQRALDGERQQFDWLFERKDGTRFWGEVVLKRTTIGPADRLLAFVRDVSARKGYERELEAQNARLDEFTSVVSHDLQNPLQVAQGRLDLAREECASEHLAAVGRAHDRMAALIEDLLTLARAGESIGEVAPVDLASLVESAWTHVEGDASLVVEDGPSVHADEPRLRQLLQNLLVNSVEHGGEGVTVTVGGLPGGFYLEDDGPGIQPVERDRVFEAGVSTAEEGTGFGLPIVERVAEAHGWDVEVTEGAAGGARFEFRGVTVGE